MASVSVACAHSARMSAQTSCMTTVAEQRTGRARWLARSSGALERIAHRHQQLFLAKRLGQHFANPETARGLDRWTQAAPEARRQREYRSGIEPPQRAHQRLLRPRARNIGDHKQPLIVVPTLFVVPNDDGVAGIAQPAFEQPSDELVRLDDDNIALVPHGAP